MASKITPLRINQLRESLQRVYRNVPRIAGAKAVAFFKQSFTRQGWVHDGVLDKWKSRKGGARNKGRAILTDTGRLRRSIRVLSSGPAFVEIGTDVPYGKAHNEGMSRPVNQSVRGHVRRSHTRKGRGGMQAVSEHKVKPFKRKINQRIPKRQFLGYSPDVMKSVEREIFRALDKAVKDWKTN